MLLHFAEKNDADMSLARFERFETESLLQISDYDVHRIEEKVFSNKDGLAMIEESVEFIIAWNKLYKKSLFKNICFPEGKVHEDEFVAHRLIYAANKIVYVDAVLYFYYQNKSGIMQSKYSLKRLDAVEGYEDRMAFYKELGLADLHSKATLTYLDFVYKKYPLVLNELHEEKIAKDLRKKFKKAFSYERKNNHYDIFEYKEYYLFAYPFRAKLFFRIVKVLKKIKHIFCK